jgi:GTPase SAR1 family protein
MGGCTNKTTVIDGTLVRIALVGDAVCGKTAILTRFAQNRFSLAYQHNQKNYTAMKSYLANEKSRPITVEVWEVQNELKVQVDFAVIVADSTMPVSQLQDYYWKWFQICQGFGWNKVCVALAKTDLNSGIDEKFLINVREKLVLDENQTVFKTSAMKNDGIDLMFKEIVTKCVGGLF